MNVEAVQLFEVVWRGRFTDQDATARVYHEARERGLERECSLGMMRASFSIADVHGRALAEEEVRVTPEPHCPATVPAPASSSANASEFQEADVA